MANPRVVCFLEDIQHEQMLSAIVRRVADDLGIPGEAVLIQTLNGRGGKPAVVAEFSAFATRFREGELPRPDIVVVALDSDCDVGAARQAVKATCDLIDGLTCVVVCVPHPYIERWYLLDPEALATYFGAGPRGAWPYECDKDYYKTELERTFSDAGYEALLGGYEYADQIVPLMDLYRAGQAEPEFGRFVEDLRDCIRMYQQAA